MDLKKDPHGFGIVLNVVLISDRESKKCQVGLGHNFSKKSEQKCMWSECNKICCNNQENMHKVDKMAIEEIGE